jgi:hypothetical protein
LLVFDTFTYSDFKHSEFDNSGKFCMKSQKLYYESLACDKNKMNFFACESLSISKLTRIQKTSIIQRDVQKVNNSSSLFSNPREDSLILSCKLRVN